MALHDPHCTPLGTEKATHYLSTSSLFLCAHRWRWFRIRSGWTASARAISRRAWMRDCGSCPAGAHRPSRPPQISSWSPALPLAPASTPPHASASRPSGGCLSQGSESSTMAQVRALVMTKTEGRPFLPHSSENEIDWYSSQSTHALMPTSMCVPHIYRTCNVCCWARRQERIAGHQACRRVNP